MPGFWRKCRIAFRCVRFAAWIVVLAGLCAFAWFNLVGLPGFLKTRLVTALHERGVALEFSRMRLRLVHGFVCDNVRVGAAKTSDRATFAAREVQLRLNFSALLHRRLLVDGLVVRNGIFTLPLTATNTLALTNLQTELRFAADDTWSLDNFSADCNGVRLLLSGEVAHAPEVRRWKMFSAPAGAAPATDHGAPATSLRNFSDTLQQIKFTGRPQLTVRLDGDARDVHSFTLRLNATAPGVRTPWFAARNLQATANLTAPADVTTNFDAAWGFWTNLQPFRLAWMARAADVQALNVTADAVACEGVWRAPELAVSELSARFGGGKFFLGARLDVATCAVTFTNDSDFDLHAVAGLFTDKVRKQLAEISWTSPPVLRVDGALVLPAWTERGGSWPDRVAPTVRLRGEVAFTNTVAAGVPVDWARTQFVYSNRVWQVRKLELAQAQTRLTLDGEVDEATKNFHGQLGGALDAASVKPFLTTDKAVRGFAQLSFDEPLNLQLDAAGNLSDLNRLTVTGHLALANFAIRHQTVEKLTADLCYSNLTADFFHPQLARAGGTQKFAAEKLTLDLAGEKLIFTNGEGNVEPFVVGRAIGPKTFQGMSPYQFLAVPHARVNGIVPLRHDADGEPVLDDADIWFDLTEPAPFRWRKFETTRITGSVHWWQNHLIVTNAVAETYGGEAHGWGTFDLQTAGPGTDFSFFITGTNTDLHRMGLALWSRTNQLEGALSGSVTVTSANSEDWRTWNGYGALQMHKGQLWSVPIFGLISPVLNTVSPGLGNNRATEAAGRFVMTNGVIFTDSLEIRTALMRLQYVGTVDLDENVNARVTAQLLRNVPVLGGLLSVLFSEVSKAFECDVTGTLGDPKVKPAYVPKIFLVPLHPLRSVEDIF
jgi:hypothetical protein